MKNVTNLILSFGLAIAAAIAWPVAAQTATVVGGTAPVLATVLSRQAPAFVVPGYLVLWAVFAVLAVWRSADAHSPRVATG